MQLNKEIAYCLNIPYLFYKSTKIKNVNTKDINNTLIEEFWLTYDLKEQQLEMLKPGLIRYIEKNLLLKQINAGWKMHLQKAEILKEIIGWRSYGQLDPLLEYQNEGFNLFIATISEIKYNAIYNLLKTQIRINKY